MGVFGDLWGVVTGRAKAVPANFANQLLQSIGRTGRPPLRGTPELLAAYSSLPRIRAVVDRISGSVASTPWKAYRTRRGARTQVLGHLRAGTAGLRAKSMKALQDDAELEEIPGHPSLDFLNRRNAMMSGSQIRQVMQIHLELVGETFGIIERSMRNWPSELWPVPPHWAKRLPTPDQPSYDFRGPNWFSPPVQIEDVLWMRHPDPQNPYARGSGIGRTLANEIDADEYAAQTTSHRFFNQGTPETIISLEGMQDEGAKMFQQRLANEARGFKKVARPFVTNAKLNVQKLSADFVDLDLVSLREFEAKVFLQTFGIPPEVMGYLENSNRATITVAAQHYATYVLVPRLSLIEETHNDILVPQFGDDGVVLLYENPIPADWDFELDAAKAFSYAFSIDELRAFGGKPPLENGAGDLHPLPFAVSFGEIAATDGQDAPAEDDIPVEDPADEQEEDPTVDDEESDAEKAWHVKDGRSAQIADAADSDDLTEPTKKVWSDQMGRWIDRESGRFSSVDVEHLKQLAVRHVEQFGGDRMDQVNQSTKRRLRKELAEGIRGGETPEELADRVRGVYKTAYGSRALMIAKTEVARSSNWASREVQKAGGVTRREWVAQPDARDAHAEMDGQEVGIDEAFVAPSGERTMYPGGFGVAELDANCRCSTRPIKAKATRRAEWKQHSKHARPWEKAAEKALKAGFKAQESQVLAKLRHVMSQRALPASTEVRPTNGVH